MRKGYKVINNGKVRAYYAEERLANEHRDYINAHGGNAVVEPYDTRAEEARRAMERLEKAVAYKARLLGVDPATL